MGKRGLNQVVNPKVDDANKDLASVVDNSKWRKSIIEDKKVYLDISGTHKVTVGLNILTKVCPNSRLADLFLAHKEFKLDKNGYFFMYRDGETFLRVINYLSKEKVR